MAAMRSHYTRHLCEPALLQAAWRADRLYTSQQSLTNTPRLWPMCTENIFGSERPWLHGRICLFQLNLRVWCII